MAIVSLSGITTLHDGTTAGSTTGTNILTAIGVNQGNRSTQTLIATDRASSGWRTEGGAPEYASRWTTTGDIDLSDAGLLVIGNFTCQVFSGGLTSVNTLANRGICLYIGDDSASTFRRWVAGGIDQIHNDAMGYGVASVISPSNDFDSLDESGTAPTLSTIDEIGLTVNEAGSSQRLAISWMGYTTGAVLTGGDGADTDGNFSDFYNYTDGSPGSDTSSLPIKVISSEAGGRVFGVSIPLIIGNGSTATAFTSTQLVSVIFRQNSDVQANYPPLAVLPNVIGLRVDAATGDLVTINNHTFQSVSPWYLKFEGTPTTDIDFADNVVLGAGRIDLVDDLDVSGCTFNNCGALIAGATNIDATVFRNLRDAYYVILDSVVDLTDMSFKSYAELSDLTGLGTSNIDATNDMVTVTGHGYPRGSVQRVTYSNGGGTDLAGLTNGNDYFIYVQNDDNFQVYDSYSNAKTQTSARDLTTAGAGTAHSFSPKAYALVIETAGTYSFDGVTFDATGTKDIYVSATSGTVTINVTGGGSIPTYDSAGATVVAQQVVTLTVDGLVTGSHVRIEETDGTLISQGTESSGSYIDTYSYTGNQAVNVIVRLYGYLPIRQPATITSAGLAVQVQMVEDTVVA